jgi:hypothetical protein
MGRARIELSSQKYEGEMAMWTIGVINGDKYGGYHQTPYRVARGGDTRSAALRRLHLGSAKTIAKFSL